MAMFSWLSGTNTTNVQIDDRKYQDNIEKYLNQLDQLASTLANDNFGGRAITGLTAAGATNAQLSQLDDEAWRLLYSVIHNAQADYVGEVMGSSADSKEKQDSAPYTDALKNSKVISDELFEKFKNKVNEYQQQLNDQKILFQQNLSNILSDPQKLAEAITLHDWITVTDGVGKAKLCAADLPKLISNLNSAADSTPKEYRFLAKNQGRVNQALQDCGYSKDEIKSMSKAEQIVLGAAIMEAGKAVPNAMKTRVYSTQLRYLEDQKNEFAVKYKSVDWKMTDVNCPEINKINKKIKTDSNSIRVDLTAELKTELARYSFRRVPVIERNVVINEVKAMLATIDANDPLAEDNIDAVKVLMIEMLENDDMRREYISLLKNCSNEQKQALHKSFLPLANKIQALKATTIIEKPVTIEESVRQQWEQFLTQHCNALKSHAMQPFSNQQVNILILRILATPYPVWKKAADIRFIQEKFFIGDITSIETWNHCHFLAEQYLNNQRYLQAGEDSSKFLPLYFEAFEKNYTRFLQNMPALLANCAMAMSQISQYETDETLATLKSALQTQVTNITSQANLITMPPTAAKRRPPVDNRELLRTISQYAAKNHITLGKPQPQPDWRNWRENKLATTVGLLGGIGGAYALGVTVGICAYVALAMATGGVSVPVTIAVVATATLLGGLFGFGLVGGAGYFKMFAKQNRVASDAMYRPLAP